MEKRVDSPAIRGIQKCTQGFIGAMIEENTHSQLARPMLPPARRRFSAVPIVEGQPAVPPHGLSASQGVKGARRFAPRPMVLLPPNGQQGGTR
jgi:hypothetical protein